MLHIKQGTKLFGGVQDIDYLIAHDTSSGSGSVESIILFFQFFAFLKLSYNSLFRIQATLLHFALHLITVSAPDDCNIT